MNRSAWMMVALLLYVVPARANVGENVEQLKHRYGSAEDVGGQMLFQHDGYSICVYFDGPHSAMEVFLRDGSIPSKVDITQDDIDAILASQGEGIPWTSIQSHSGKPTWVRADGKLVARFTSGDKLEDKYLMVMLNAK
ncbi:MAG: hypothetical protein LV479_10765 [Methylacidiphilales bacterium]|nr:hypothetical protein [Candidatus Methylacidiphilales bacterium]